METAPVGSCSPEISSPSNKITRRPQKRKRQSDGDAASKNAPSAVRPRARGADYHTYGQEGSFQLSCPARTDTAYTPSSSSGSASTATTETTPHAPVAVLSGPGRVPVPVPVTGLQSEPQAYQDYPLHTTNSDPSSHTCAQGRCPEPIFCHDNGAMPIACTEAQTGYGHRSTELQLPLSTTYNPLFHQPQWYTPDQSGDIIAQSRFQQVSSSSPSHSLPLPLSDINSTSYPLPFAQQIDLLGQDNVHTPIVADLAASFQHAHTFQAQQAFGLAQPQASGEGLVHLQHHHNHHLLLHHHHHHHLQGHKPLFLPRQGTQQVEEGSVPFQASQEPSVAYTAYDIPQFKHDPSAHMAMDGGQYVPLGHQEAPLNDYHTQQPIGQLPTVPHDTGSAVSSMYTGSGQVVTGAIQAQDTGSVDWQQPVDYPIAEPHRDGSDDFGHDHDMPDDLGEFDDTDTDSDVHGDSQNTRVGEAEAAPSSMVKQEEPAPSSVSELGRSALTPIHRKQTAETRKTKACTRCRMQKMRCETDAADPTGDCVGCKSFSKTSKKTIHRMPCYRGKITDAVLFRSGGLRLTNRWKGAEMKDVGDRIDPKDIRTIAFTLGICTEAITVEVVAFQAQSGDVTARFWTVPDGEHGVRKKKDLAHYCLANIQKTATYFEEYIKKNAIEVMQNERAGGKMHPRDMIEKTYQSAIGRYTKLSSKPATTATEEREMRFLGNIFILWFAMRQSTGSSWICGEELLGMKPETKDETYPLFGRVSVPRMILAQFDSINHTRLLTKYGKLVLGELEALMSRNAPNWWFSVYTCLFILLREASWISEDRYRHARNNYGQRHWHYYNGKNWPGAIVAADRHRTHLSELSSEQHAFVMETYADPSVQRQLNVWRRYKAENGRGECREHSEYHGRTMRLPIPHSE
ncbi:hypothetical protein V8C37DRAFT_413155 [Trichoderma ceciliae]